jgi:hypothetical protein
MSDNKTIRDAMNYVEIQLKNAEEEGGAIALFMAKKMFGTIKANLELGKTLDDVIDTELG